MIAGVHRVSVDPIVEAEYFAATRIDRTMLAVFHSLTPIVEWSALSRDAARLAATWLAPMSKPMKLAHFGDSLIAAVATIERATLVTADKRIGRVFPVAVLEY